ncbi:ABC transporter permease [Anaerosalibacter bizertensis]|uniref:ABC transporter permease n=1 Tax=Anaerosalibacter bizertensis TaxID=932217 RepID=A0A9Q4AB01_9FIRM|nr:ABC transporter permease [Anaerosalibacter bizertensis]MBV1818452.1 ABC transporter permease [Bacteroidales bacterium MSK.15.36]HHV27460.1 ABC transporter permease [Tissierellia bacterium]MBU5293607.1 ABC transporter permease [Anaerosalibacter bizertensis]MCB5560572.1 ABC transporter permease [Anaerosalibacter bizertensis]MCG4564331.1 ABC transporter permease [Anaerosalibacter bizertensis]
MDGFLLSILQQSFIFSIMVMGVYITYKILNFPDLSADGSFTLGASVSAALIIKGVNPYISLVIAMLAGGVAGAMTGFLNVKLKIKDILSGILVMVGLYSINLRIMGVSNVSLFNYETIFSNGNIMFINFIILILSAVLFTLFFKTKLGYVMKGTGDNENMIISLGLDTGKIKILALSISNGMIALSGGILAQYQGFSDINMGTGTVVMGLASIVLAYSIFRNIPFLNASVLCIIGTFLYRTSIALSLKLGFNPSDLKLISAIIVIIALTFGNESISLKKSFKLKRGLQGIFQSKIS